MPALAASLLEKIETAAPAPASSVSATSACRWRSSSPAAGFHATGIDLDQRKVDAINAGRSYIPDVPTADVPRCATPAGSTRRPTSRSSRELDTINICVPTPLRKTKDPDMSYVVVGGRSDREAPAPGHAHRARVDDVSGHDGGAAAADARGDRPARPARTSSSRSRPSASIRRNPTFNTQQHAEGRRRRDAGLRHASPRRSTRTAIDTIVPVSSTQVAEMVKLLENTFRAVNIGLVNELALMCDRMGIDVWEVVDAAKTKPFGFMPFYPGPGPRRPLHPDRPVLPVVEGEAERASRRASSSWPATSTARCRTTSSTRSATR